MFLEFANRGIWPDILSYKRLQNECTAKIIFLGSQLGEEVTCPKFKTT